ncbi:hypothetical protein H0H81_011934 [Sphagnurus paluster]|uniref:Uncharacterized protein n=1 Tax=Sphagnurus paluster TaxID=117069 RepID=A0A9P7GH75_9AGAR|nr:hypothetical protein H0H81_011934 [Sphagnurus paluster]
MIFTYTPLVLAALPFVSGAGVHKLKLKKLPPSLSRNPALEGAYLAEKYGAQLQSPMMGVGGSGRRIPEHLSDTQAGIEGGRRVPLIS